MLKQEIFNFDTRKEANAEAKRMGARKGDFEIVNDYNGGGYFIAWVRKS